MKTVLFLSNTFNTISVKPVRLCDESFTVESISAWKKEYSKLTNYIIDRALNYDDIKLLKTLLNGNDYFGKFILRAFSGQRCLVRCDAGLSRFTLDTDGSIYICPAAFNNEKLRIGCNGIIDDTGLKSMFNNQIEKKECESCCMKYFCGGECIIEKCKNSMKNNEFMCSYKKHLILLAMYLNLELRKNKKIYLAVYNFCNEVLFRFRLDVKLSEFLLSHKEYNFCDGKKYMIKCIKNINVFFLVVLFLVIALNIVIIGIEKL